MGWLVRRFRLVAGVAADWLPGAAGLLAAEGGDGVGAADGPVHAGLLESLADDGFAAGLHDAGADEQAALAEPVVAHAGGVVLEVAEFLFDSSFLTPSRGYLRAAASMPSMSP